MLNNITFIFNMFGIFFNSNQILRYCQLIVYLYFCSCGTLSQSVVTGGSEMKSSRTMSAISSKQTDVTVSTSFERPEQQKQIDSLSQTITSGRKVADIILKTFESLPVNYTSGRDILSSDKTAILRLLIVYNVLF